MIDPDRVKNGNVDEELQCSICKGVLRTPYQSTQCEHVFCFTCIHKWIPQGETCPIDRLKDP